MRLTTSFADGGWREPAVDNPIMGPRLCRLRLPLDNHDSDLLLVGDSFERGGHYVQLEVPRAESDGWTYPDWMEAYARLAREWRSRFFKRVDDRG